MDQLTHDEQYQRIGTELYGLWRAGRLDFASFQRLLREAIAVGGPDNDELEMFCPFVRQQDWWDWMMQELRNSPTRHVA